MIVKTFLLRVMACLENVFTGKNRIFIPRIRIQVGGPKSFMVLFKEHAHKRGIHVTHNRFCRADNALIPIAMDPDLLSTWKSVSGRRSVIQRLDGVFYDPEKSDYDVTRNAQLKTVYHQLADKIIFQSEYSKQQCEHYLGKTTDSVSSRIILNGTDLSLFHPQVVHPPIAGRSIRFITSGNFRDTEMLEPIIKALDRLTGQFQFTLTVVGPITCDLNPELAARPYLVMLGKCDRQELARYLRQSDIFMFSFLNPNCPNSVIEATASGLPVVSFQSGAMPELCDFNQELLAEVRSLHPVIQRRSEIENGTDALLEKLQLCIREYERFRANAIQSRDRFGIENCIEAYFSMIFSEP